MKVYYTDTYPIPLPENHNFPYHKETSDLDIELEDGTDDRTCLNALEKGLIASTQRFNADLRFSSGAGSYRKDRYGRLALTKAGLVQRDCLVLRYLKETGLPVAATLAGGYAPDIQDIVDIHFHTIEIALEFHQKPQ